MNRKIGVAIKRFCTNAGHGRGTRQRLTQRVDEYLDAPERRNGRGVDAKVLQEVGTTLMHLNSATKWQDDGSLGNLHTLAKKLVNTAGHAKVPFEELMVRATKLRGAVNKEGERRNNRKRIEGCETLREELPKGYVVERLCTLAQLMSAGGTLENCATDNRWLHRRLRQREADFYLVRDQDNEAVAMCEVDLETSEITDFLGQRNADVRLPHPTLVAMLSKLGVGGDDMEACLQRGAASIFATGAADLDAPDYRSGRLRVWAVKRQLVVQRRGGKGKKWRGQWSSFRWDGVSWERASASRLDRLDGLMTRHRRIAKLARRAAK